MYHKQNLWLLLQTIWEFNCPVRTREYIWIHSDCKAYLKLNHIWALSLVAKCDAKRTVSFAPCIIRWSKCGVKIDWDYSCHIVSLLKVSSSKGSEREWYLQDLNFLKSDSFCVYETLYFCWNENCKTWLLIVVILKIVKFFLLQ